MSMYKKEMMESEMVKVISEALRSMKDPRVKGIVSVTRVELSKDYRYGRVYFSIFEDDAKKNEKIFEILKNAKGYFKTRIAKNFRSFKTPELTFVHDRGIKKAFELDKLFKKIKNDERNSES